jgi:hypothetical protein
MTQVIIFALANGLTLAAGAFLGNIWKLKQKTIAAFMAFGGSGCCPGYDFEFSFSSQP